MNKSIRAHATLIARDKVNPEELTNFIKPKESIKNLKRKLENFRETWVSQIQSQKFKEGERG